MSKPDEQTVFPSVFSLQTINLSSPKESNNLLSGTNWPYIAANVLIVVAHEAITHVYDPRAVRVDCVGTGRPIVVALDGRKWADRGPCWAKAVQFIDVRETPLSGSRTVVEATLGCGDTSVVQRVG
jgi:hypothetical protein